jgi:hypothetical protein
MQLFSYANNLHACTSTVSLILFHQVSSTSTYTLDNVAHLISNIHKTIDKGSDWHMDLEYLSDPVTTHSCYQHTQCYSANLSPIDHSGSVTKHISWSHCHVSLPIVNFASASLNNYMLLSGGKDSPPDNS